MLTKVVPRVFGVSAIILLFLLPVEGGLRLWVSAVILFALDELIFVWMRFSKSPNLIIKEDAVVICGLRIDRRDIQAWRVFRTINSGERGRYIEIQLKSVPLFPFRWKLAKLFEQVPTSGASARGIELAKEPRIIALLNSWDLIKDEIYNALKKTGHP